MQELGPAERSFSAPPPVILRLDRRIVARLVDAAHGLAKREQIRGFASTARDLNPILRSSRRMTMEGRPGLCPHAVE